MAVVSNTPVIISRQEAINHGDGRYYTGESCPSGHISERITGNRACVECQKLYSAKYREAHPTRVKAKRVIHNRRYYAANKDKVSENGKAYRARIGDELLKTKKKQYENNRSAILAKAKANYRANREAAITRAINWAKANRDKRKAYENNRRAQKKQAGGTFTAEDISRILTAQREKCAICKRCIARKFHIDHIVALSRGGSNYPRNLQLLCPPCNMKKHTSDPIDYMQSLGYLI